MNRTTATTGPNSASREAVRTTSTDTGHLTTNGHVKQAEGGTSRDGTYTLGQGGTGDVALKSNSNSADAGGFRFATLHGTLATGANLNGNGSYVSAAESNGATSQTGAVNIIGTAKLNANGSEGSFSRTTTATGESWSGTRVTSTDTGNGTTSHGGTVKIDENGNVTATNLSNSDTGGGTRTTVYYSYSGSNDEPTEGNPGSRTTNGPTPTPRRPTTRPAPRTAPTRMSGT